MVGTEQFILIISLNQTLANNIKLGILFKSTRADFTQQTKINKNTNIFEKLFFISFFLFPSLYDICWIKSDMNSDKDLIYGSNFFLYTDFTEGFYLFGVVISLVRSFYLCNGYFTTLLEISRLSVKLFYLKMLRVNNTMVLKTFWNYHFCPWSYQFVTSRKVKILLKMN